METVVFDIETTRIVELHGVPQIPETVHLLTASEVESDREWVFGPDPAELKAGVVLLQTAKTLVAHNGQAFDVPVLQHHFQLDTSKCEFWDSLIMSRLYYSNIKEEEDYAMFEKHKKTGGPFTGDLIGKHGLAAWGARLGYAKGDYAERMEKQGLDPWAEVNSEMIQYAIDDTRLLKLLWIKRILPRMQDDIKRHAARLHKKKGQVSGALKDPKTSWHIEHYMHKIMENEVKRNGIKFDVEKATKLAADLSSRSTELRREVSESFPPRFEPVKWEHKFSGGPRTLLQQIHPTNTVYYPQFSIPFGYERHMWGEPFEYKREKKVQTPEGFIKLVSGPGAPFVKAHWKELNPASRVQVQRRLLEAGWSPEDFTEKGNPVLDEPAITKLVDDYPQVASLAKFLLVEKRLGQIQDGDNAWLKCVSDAGFIHPTIQPCATVTFRATHSNPNISQTPSVKKGKTTQEPLLGEAGKWGWECRECFTVPEGWWMVGSDLEGIELRCWAHFLWLYDNGHLANIVLNEDVHENNRVILGFADRRDAKMFLYALMYGAGDEKLGSIIAPLASPYEQTQLGASARARFIRGVEGMSDLGHWLRRKCKHGWVEGLDGRRVPVRKEYSALNTLLQSAGAIISKYWIMYAMHILTVEHGLKTGYDNDFTLMIYSHDELQFGCRKELVPIVKDACIRAAPMAGKKLGMKLPTTSNAVDGPHWAATH